MPDVEIGGTRLSYRVDGPADRPALLLSNSLGTSVDLWADQLTPLSRAFRVVRYDTRGHGRSDAPSGAYTIERLGRDALAVLDAAGVARAHVCGLSLGGLTAMWMARHAPERVGRLVLASTGARIGTPRIWEQRIDDVRAQGMAAIAESAVTRWFTEGFRRGHPRTAEAIRDMVAACAPAGYIGACAALRDADLTDALPLIGASTLVVVGTHDVVTPPEAGELLRQHIPGADLVALDAAHLCNVEQPGPFTGAVLEFLSS